jgi:hypothetical protein
MKQTAVEFLVAHLIEYGFDLSAHKLEIEQAKEMEKQQIIEAHAVGRIKECSGINTDGEHYYNETFNK